MCGNISSGWRDAVAGWGAGAAFAAVLARALISPAPATSRAAAPLSGAWAAALGLAAWGFTIWPWIGRGVPAFAHDWKWPLLRAQLDAWPSILHSLWLPWGAGAPAVQELALYPIVLCAWVLGRAFSPEWSLYLILAAIFVICSTGAARCARAFELEPPWQTLLAFLYPLAPAATNRLSAGHLPWLLGYAPDKTAVTSDLIDAARDPNAKVRNNVTRALGAIAVLAAAKPELGIHIDPSVFIEMLDSVTWTDRNKASFLFEGLTRSKSPDLLALLRHRSLHDLKEMARWKSGHALTAALILGRVAGWSDEQTYKAWVGGRREDILTAAEAMESK